jgi:DNA polymerase III delta prime subunit
MFGWLVLQSVCCQWIYADERDRRKRKKFLEAYHTGGKTADEIIAFIMSGEDKPEEDEKPKKRRKRI